MNFRTGKKLPMRKKRLPFGGRICTNCGGKGMWEQATSYRVYAHLTCQACSGSGMLEIQVANALLGGSDGLYRVEFLDCNLGPASGIYSSTSFNPVPGVFNAP
jgi:hypothetical protein